jgi:tight adherence protein B
MDMDEDTLVIGLIAAVGAIVLLVFVYSMLSGGSKAQKRLTSLTSPKQPSSPIASRNLDPTKRRKAIAESLKEFENQNKEKKKKVTIEQRIAQAGLKIERNLFFILSGACGAVFALLLFALNGDPLVALGGAIVGMFGLPLWVLSFLRNRRIMKFVNEFPGAIDVIIRGVRAGLPVADCFRVIANESPEPVRSEFRQMVEAQAVGLTIGEASERLVDRMPIPEASFFSIVVNITQKTGGNLSESLSNLSTVLRDRKKMKAKILAMSMEAKVSAGIIGSLPFLVCGALYFLQPGYIMMLFTTNPGKIVVGGGLGWMFIGVMIMRKMIDFDF